MLDLVLDSGAFTAWSRGTPVDLDEYIAYIKANAEGVDHYVALDVIPGAFGVKPSPAEVEASASQGWENLIYMQREGLDPVPVFHQGERFWWLERMIQHGCKYIGISPANDRTTQQKRLWLDRVFELVCDSNGYPRVKTHAFGVTAVPLLTRYPWYSADSATWVLVAARGAILVPKMLRGDFNYLVSPQVVFTSNKAKQSLHKEHWEQLSAARRQQATAFLAQAGVTPEQVRDSHRYRAMANVAFFRGFAAAKKDAPFTPKKRHLFEDA